MSDIVFVNRWDKVKTYNTYIVSRAVRTEDFDGQRTEKAEKNKIQYNRIIVWK